MTDARETIRRGVEALVRYHKYGIGERMPEGVRTIADAFSAALSILKGENEEANERLQDAIILHVIGEEVDWDEVVPKILRAASGLGEGE